MKRSWIIFASLLLIFSQLVIGLSGDLSWCLHPDGQISLETRADQRDCHDSETESSEKDCNDIPADPSPNAYANRADLNRSSIFIHQIAFQFVQPSPWDVSTSVQSVALATDAINSHPTLPNQALCSLTTVILLT